MERMKFGVVVFPGSNCDHDAYYALKHILGCEVTFLWHKGDSIGDCDAIILPGGFSYGDYLRCGAIARFSPIMRDVIRFAGEGGYVIGVCNGFQILTEAGLLPGALLRNESLRFVCRTVHLRVEHSDSVFTRHLQEGSLLRMPVAHGEGNYYADPEIIAGLESHGQVLFRYADADGRTTGEGNPNGSINNIAGIVNREGNILGMMPHPERSAETLLGSADGLSIFKSLLLSVNAIPVLQT